MAFSARLAPLTVVLMLLATICQADAAPMRKASSCYQFDLGTLPGSSFAGGVKGPLPSSLKVTRGVIYGVVHRCADGVLAPRRASAITSVRYYLDDPARRRTPLGLVKDTTPFFLGTRTLSAGRHRLTAVVTFGRTPNYKPLVVTRNFRIPAAPTPKPSTRTAIKQYGQCGGAGGACVKGSVTKPCVDSVWPRAKCSGAGFSCFRLDIYYRQCREGPF